MIDLYTSPTPNGYKASVTLEELELDYTVHVIDIQAGDQKNLSISRLTRMAGFLLLLTVI